MSETQNNETSRLIHFNEPIIHFVDQLLQDAIKKQVSDIHIESLAQHCRIRFRHDGLLREVEKISTTFATQIITRLKVMANLNIAEKRLPQDGHISLQDWEQMDIRINSCPMLYGEKIVLRLLNKASVYVDIHQIGLLDFQKKLLLQKLLQPQGMILVTGPTGSGKTTTLYSALCHLNQIEKNIVTIEDPIEIELPGINQTAINPKIGLDFANLLRAFLRQDPDVVMVGEIRDKETAHIALQAAQTGHLVLSTLHTNNAIESLARLQQMGLATYHLVSSITLIIAQRLIRVLCENCKKKDTKNCYQPIGCSYCYNGFKGRTGIFEFIPMTPELAHLLLTNGLSKFENYLSLHDAAEEKIKAGISHKTEIFRVLV